MSSLNDLLSSLSAEAQLTILAIFLGPVLAVVLSMLITILYQRWAQKRGAKAWVLSQVISYRHHILHDESVRALNQIDLVFSRGRKDAKVRECWKDFVRMIRTDGVGLEDKQKKYNELITLMTEALGYGKAFSYLDADRVLFPAPNSPPPLDPKASELQAELLRVFKATKTLNITPVDGDDEQQT